VRLLRRLTRHAWTGGDYTGYAHHLQPIRHGGTGDLDNCVYLCWGHHLLLGHGMAPFGIDPQGGGSDAWVQSVEQSRVRRGQLSRRMVYMIMVP
jgi:hypothetical protein